MLSFLSLLAICQTSLAEPDFNRIDEAQSIEYKRWRMMPIPTRAGFLRFVGSEIAKPEWTDLYLKRFYETDEPISIKLALLDLIVRTNGNWQKSLFNHYHSEPEPKIRRGILEMTKHLDIDEKLNLIQTAANDESPIVRASAMRAIGYCPKTNFNKELELGLEDDNKEVLEFAARSVGWKKVTSLTSKLTPLLEHNSGDVRYQTINALKKLDPQKALTLAPSLVNDSDARVDRIAKKLLNIR